MVFKLKSYQITCFITHFQRLNELLIHIYVFWIKVKMMKNKVKTRSTVMRCGLPN